MSLKKHQVIIISELLECYDICMTIKHACIMLFLYVGQSFSTLNSWSHCGGWSHCRRSSIRSDRSLLGSPNLSFAAFCWCRFLANDLSCEAS